MLMDIVGSGSLNVADVSGSNEIFVQSLEQYESGGFVSILSEISAATEPINDRQVRAFEANSDYRLRIAEEHVIYHKSFVQMTAQTSDVQTSATTHVVDYTAGGGFIMNASGLQTVGRTIVQTYRSFNIMPSDVLNCVCSLRFQNEVFAAGVWEFGLRSAAVSATTVTEGVCARITMAGELTIVFVCGTQEFTSRSIKIDGIIFPQRRHTIRLAVKHNYAALYVDDRMCIQYTIPTDSPAKGMTQYTAMQMYMYNSVRLYNSATTYQKYASTVILYEWSVINRTHSHFKNIQTVRSGNGLFLPHNAAGLAQITNWANSAAPASATLSNTTAGYGTVGGLFQFVAIAPTATPTDYALFALQHSGVAISSITDHGRNLVITGVTIDVWNTGAANSATVPTTLAFGMAIGSTAVSLATSDAVAARAPKRIPLGTLTIPINAVVGQAATDSINIQFDTPLFITAHTQSTFHIIMRVIRGAATASQVIQGMVGVHGYYE